MVMGNLWRKMGAMEILMGERGLKILQVKGVIIHGNSKERQPILKKWEGKVKMKNRILEALSYVFVCVCVF